MNKKVNEVLKSWFDKYGENSSVYSDERIAEIALNCVSLSETWLDKVRKIKGMSLELALFNKENVLCNTLHGVTADNLAETILDIVVNNHEKYSKIALNYFGYVDEEKMSGLVGELEIS